MNAPFPVADARRALIDRHAALIDAAVKAVSARVAWSPFKDSPSTKIHGPDKPVAGKAAFEAGLPCGEEANLGKLLSAEAAWEAGEACMQTHGGFAYAREYDVERKWREARVQRTAPISTNLILSYIAEHVLGLPRSY